MKADIIERLTHNIQWLTRDGFDVSARNAADAKAEILLLRQQRDELLAALEYIRGLASCEEVRDFPTIHNTAHAAIASVKESK